MSNCQKCFPWLMQIHIFGTTGIAFIMSIFLVSLNLYINDNGYLGNNMDYNWDTRYIKDIMFSKELCFGEWERLTIGEWSGFGGGVFITVHYFFNK